MSDFETDTSRDSSFFCMKLLGYINRDEQIANKWIKQMQDMGFTPDDMIRTIRLAKEKYLELKKNERNSTNQKN